ncbi:MAG: ankyrin repeat domain-containing protein, partial [Spirochaetaceae bacterium]|nr:ankyrin repeat domain-containing protein [Spirochaetaceae bacterium]
MKLSIVCSKSRINELPQLRDTLDGLFIEYRVWYHNTEFSESELVNGLEECLDYSTYVLCAVDSDDFNSPWVHYTLGYQRGRTDRMTFWVLPEESLSVPEWTNGFVVIPGSRKDVYDYYAEVEVSWSEETRAKMARQIIRDHNIEVSPRAFIETVQKGDRFLMGQFLEAGFSPSLRDSSGVPVLNHAIRLGHIPLVLPLIEAGAELDGEAEDRGSTPVMDAASVGLAELTQIIIALGAELDHSSRDGQT